MQNLIIKKIYDPYPVWIIDNFLPEDLANKVLENWPKENEGWNSGHSVINEKKKYFRARYESP